MWLNVQIPVLFFLLVNTVPSDASLFSWSSQSFTHAAHRVRRRAVKRTAELPKDLRRAFNGMLFQETLDASTTSHQHPHCVIGGGLRSSSKDGNGSGDSAHTSSGVPETSTASTSSTPSASSPSPTGNSSPVPSSPWKLFQSYQGDTFFNGWSFFTYGDPTHGVVQYVDQNTANSSNLIEINDQGHAIMRVETTEQVSENRMSVRITTTATYTGGIVLLDAVHMPTGCGTWPSFWSNGANGEIDIVEGVNDYANNQATAHTSHGCTLPSTSSAALNITGTVVDGTNCAAAETGNVGCGMTATQSNTFGVGFNNIGGGVYAMQWVESGISIWFFPRNAIPSDITSGAPQPDGWGVPMARWPATDCDPSQFFSDHSAIFDTTFCGDWAGSVWSSAGMPGQEQSCATRTGVSTCEDFVNNHGSSFTDAYWEVSYVKIYQLQQD
ncbi:concanavalin A-like lectin/glucanase domain-containing protein [Cubamyces lactineus]|nr:concanavalin A-like lectin/glucanase domain-containing protein [Cubamyces lactineus]